MSTASGRVRHNTKVTVYLTDDELHALDRATLDLRIATGTSVDRGRIVREALTGFLGNDLLREALARDLTAQAGAS